MNQAISRYTSQLPRESTLQEIIRKGTPYAFGASTPELAYFCLAEVRCAAYVIIIKMHQAAELLEQFQGGTYRLSAGLGMGEEKRLAAAKQTTAIAQDVFLEVRRSAFPFRKNTWLIACPVSVRQTQLYTSPHGWDVPDHRSEPNTDCPPFICSG